jgi:hypothetical protein
LSRSWHVFNPCSLIFHSLSKVYHNTSSYAKWHWRHLQPSPPTPHPFMYMYIIKIFLSTIKSNNLLNLIVRGISFNHLSFQNDFCLLLLIFLLMLFSNHRLTLNPTSSLTSHASFHQLDTFLPPPHMPILHVIFNTQHLVPQSILINQQPQTPLFYKR